MIATQAAVPWVEVVYLSCAIVAAFGAFIAFPMLLFFLKDRQKVLLRQEVSDESRRREQLEVRVAELTKERDTLRDSLADERKKPDVSGIAATLQVVAEALSHASETDLKILDRLTNLNGGLTHANEGLRATRETVEALALRLGIVERDS